MMLEIIEQGKKSFINNYAQIPLVIERGEGVYLFDSEGKKYLDFVSGIAVNALGYQHKGLNDALKAQIDRFTHCSNLYWNQPSIDAAQKLTKASGLDKVFFCNSGAEANESAIKLARKYAKKVGEDEKVEIISMKNSFHGRTMGAITVTGQKKYQKGLDPLLPGVKYCNFNDTVDFLMQINEFTCAVILEIIQGEGGIVNIEPEFLKAVKASCVEHDVVLIYDEVQTGIGRTGKMFAYQHVDVKPDILTLAKGLGAGIPIGAIVATEKVAAAFEPGDHAATFGGNPLATTAANVVLDELMNENLLDHIVEMGEYLEAKLTELMLNKSCVTGVKGMGLMMGITINDNSIAKIKEQCMEKGLLIVGAGKDVIRLVPPLIVEKKDIDEAMRILDECL